MAKTVVITGAAKGIGAATARKFAEAGYNVVIHYHTSREQAETLAKELAPLCRVETYAADLTVSAGRSGLAAFVKERFGGADILVLNAGISRFGLLTGLSEEDVLQVINTNLIASILTARSFVPYMVEQKSGRIITVGSIFGKTGGSCETAYSASKAGISGFTKALAKELGPSGITVNCVAPGYIETDMNARLSDTERAALIESTSLCRPGRPEDAANAIFFLAGEESAFITGQTLGVDGGIIL